MWTARRRWWPPPWPGASTHAAPMRARWTFTREFDAVFSNAVLHWIREADDVLAGVVRALRPGGRFVAEFGGHTNVAAIAVAIRAVFGRHAVAVEAPWYYPTPDEYRERLEAHGFVVDTIASRFRDPRRCPPAWLPGSARFASRSSKECLRNSRPPSRMRLSSSCVRRSVTRRATGPQTTFV